jgi:hypothetical protein
MSKDQEYSPLISEPGDEVEIDSQQFRRTWTSKITPVVLVLAGLLAVETIALALAILFIVRAQPPHPTCIFPAGSHRVLYCGCNKRLAPQ